MSTEQANGTTIEEKKDKVAEVTEKLDNLAVDTTNEANDAKQPARRGGFRGRGRGRGRGGHFYQPRPPYEDQMKKLEEDLASKKVIETGVKGHAKWFSVRGRYGFVARDKPTDENEDFFVHQTAITKSSTIKFYLRTLDDDEPVVFDIVEGLKGPEAANVTGPDGENVRGSRFARTLLTHWRTRGRGGARGRGGRGRGAPRQTRDQDGDEKDEKEKSDTIENSGDGETRGKRRTRRHGKLQPDAPSGEKGDGDAAAATTDAAPAAEKKKKRQRKGNKEPTTTTEQKEETAAPAKA